MSRAKIYLAGAVIAAASLVATGPVFAGPTPTATNLLFDDGPLGTTVFISVDGTVVTTFGPDADQQTILNSFNVFATGAFSIPITNISILDPGNQLVSDEFQISSGNFVQGSTLILTNFGSNDVTAVDLPISNPIFETGLVQTLFSTQDEQGNTLDVQFLSEVADPPTNSVPEPSTLAFFGAALAMLGMMTRRRSASSRV